MGIFSTIFYFTSYTTSQSAPGYEPPTHGTDRVSGASGCPAGIIHLLSTGADIMRTQGSLLPLSPSPHLWAPASVPIENGDHSSLNQLPPSSPQIPSILFGDCKHLETGLTHTCRVLCWGYKILLLIVAQQKSESSRTWFIAWWFLPNPHQRFENIRLQREYNLSKIMKALFLSSYNIECFFSPVKVPFWSCTTFSACSNKHLLIIITGDHGNWFHKMSSILVCEERKDMQN